MKCEINCNGYMLIKSETELESYALGKWLEENKIVNGKLETNKLLFNWSYKEKE